MTLQAACAAPLNAVEGRACSDPFPWFYSGFLLLCLVQFSNAWYWPVHPEFGNLATPRFDKVFGSPFQYFMWVLISGVLVSHLLRHGAARLVEVLAPWALFCFAGLLAGLLGFDWIASLRHTIFWLLMAVSAAVAGIELAPRRALDALRGSLVIVLAASVVVALWLPGAGTQLYGTISVWNGVFVSKNQLGWVAALALMVGWHGLGRHESRPMSACLVAVAVIALVGSQSRGSLVAAAAGSAYMLLLVILSKRFSEALTAMLAIGAALATLVFLRLVLPALLDVMGRDATLTGRTDIWDVYLSAMLKTPWLGEGPGSFTGLSSITERLAQSLASLGGIYTPHNMFLGAFGDAGLVGLAAFCGSLLYVGFVDPIRAGSLVSKALAGMCIVTVVGGMVEAHEVYSAGVGGFMLVLMRAIVVHGHAPGALDEAPDEGG